MIKGLMGGSSIVVSGGNTSVPYVSQNTNNPMQGMIRVWGTDMQVYDGNNWMTMATSYATVELTPEVQTLLQWARDKRNQELEYASLSKEHPAVQNAINAIKRAEEQLDLVVKLSKEHGETVETS
jgi:hypothetical protein